MKISKRKARKMNACYSITKDMHQYIADRAWEGRTTRSLYISHLIIMDMDRHKSKIEGQESNQIT